MHKTDTHCSLLRRYTPLGLERVCSVKVIVDNFDRAIDVKYQRVPAGKVSWSEKSENMGIFKSDTHCRLKMHKTDTHCSLLRRYTPLGLERVCSVKVIVDNFDRAIDVKYQRVPAGKVSWSEKSENMGKIGRPCS